MPSHKPKTSDFIKRVLKSKLFWATVVILLLLAGAATYAYYSLIKDALILEVRPSQPSYSALSGEEAEIGFEVEVQKYWGCVAECTSSFTDHFFKERQHANFTIGGGSPYSISYLVRAPEWKEGKSAYSLTVSCTREANLLCPSAGVTTSETRLATIDFRFSEEKRALVSGTESSLKDALASLTSADATLQVLAPQVSALDAAVAPSLLPKYFELSSSLSGQALLLEKQADAWNSGRFQDIDAAELAQVAAIASGLPLEVSALSSGAAAQVAMHEDARQALQAINASLPAFRLAAASAAQYKDPEFSSLADSALFTIRDINSEFSVRRKISPGLAKSIAGSLRLLEETVNRSAAIEEGLVAKGMSLLEDASNELCSKPFCIANLTSRQLRGEICNEAAKLGTEMSAAVAEMPSNDSRYVPLNDSLAFLQEYSSAYCPVPKPLGNLNTFSLPLLDMGIIPESRHSINITIAVHQEQCCVLGACEACGLGDENNLRAPPVLFLHGHSFDSAADPRSSLDAFSKMQVLLEDDGYVNVGRISLYELGENNSAADWSFMPLPVSTRGTYYYDVYRKGGVYSLVPQKYDSIETYAIRLRDVVEELKARTGSEKVDIVAHSMGGLVTRRYLQLFGEDSVRRIVLVGTPNHGIDESVQAQCTLFGAERECEEMHPDSLFLNKLNDPRNNPKSVEVYTIAGTGCISSGKQGKQGDGVVAVDSVQLPFAENFAVDGSCDSFGKLLHNEMLNPERYPEVYESIVDMLNRQD